MTEPAGRDEAPAPEETVEGSKCPFARVNQIADASKLLRSKTAVAHSPDLFAGRKADEVNGEINVREFLAASMMFVEGDSHRRRRKLLNPLVRADALQGIREDIVLPEADKLMQTRLATPDADGMYRLDLVEFLELVFIHFTARLIGLVDIASEERLALLRSFAGPIAAGTSSAYLSDRTAVNAEALRAKAEYVEQFFNPSLQWHREQRARIEAGEIAEDDVPGSLLKMVAAQLAPEWADEDNAVVESTLLFAASVGTSTQSIIHTIDLLQTWFVEHPEDLERKTESKFLLNSLQEVIRMRAPFSPYTTRLVLEEGELSDGTKIVPGQELHMEYVKANRDTEVFGEDAAGFNPNRADPTNGMPRYGLGFGMGTHQCYGLRVVVGNDGNGGAHLELLRKLMAVGVRPDPDNPPVGLEKDMSKFEVEDIPRYTEYQVVLDDWASAASGARSVAAAVH
ncbi:cytochrome P450 [Mycobacterium sp. MAA66]|uniref:cytochrome P450 n=1 Tax=Mycobacterium sp. MAA66 TaxID=3156297 RepID=UPI003518B903